ncbi:MAG: ethanolamine ammonia-lyase subunit EutB [Myxococcales bacterium]|nr:ethanolamine ammonia-lyase subunit EutB [Myxococcales bacterium]MDP3502505.1 ethanolamine ammonia-lyase subunit EutB [Myxococcales bacterium]
MAFSTRLHGEHFTFQSLKEVLGRANEPRSGDRQAGLAARSMREMAAAKSLLADVTLHQLYESPSVPFEQDEVTRVCIDGIAPNVLQRVKGWTVGEFREWLLDDRTTGEEISGIALGLTPEMVAAVAKLMSNLDLVMAGKKMRVVAKCNNTIGVKGRISSRLQPNHPTDDVEGVLAAVKDGLSFGNGDAVIGVNPSTGDIQGTVDILTAVKDLMRTFRVPTQNCVLSHITIQMAAVRRGAPLDLMFQSIAGSQGANQNFGVSVSVLDEAYDLARREGTAQGPNVMYFETGQGTALSANAHHGTDQVTMEARAYGLARRYSPFLVNSVVGFIGPEYLRDAKEITRAGLEDHFMGKLIGISMGCDACYTNHAIADQNDQENLEMLLAAAGVNYLMGIPMGDDVMLNYQTTSFHNNAALRELFGLKPAPEFEAWLERMGLWRNGKLTDRAGDASVFEREFGR